MNNIQATNRATGEVVELPANTPEEIVSAWQIAQEYEKTAKSLKDQLREVVPSLVTDRGVSEPIGKVMFRVSNIQRKTYDKSTLREVLDADTFDTMLKPDKKTVDTYIKELVKTGDPEGVSSKLRESMVAEGMPYQVIKLEKLSA